MLSQFCFVPQQEKSYALRTSAQAQSLVLAFATSDQATGSLSAAPVSAARVPWVSLVATSADGRSIPMGDGLQVFVCVKNRSICKGQSRVSTGTQTPGHPRSSPPALRPTTHWARYKDSNPPRGFLCIVRTLGLLNAHQCKRK